MKCEWNEKSLSEIIENVIDYRGKTPKKLGGDWCDSGYRVLSAKNIKTGNIVQEESIRYVDEGLYSKWMKEEVQKGDIFITSEAPFGQILYWDSDEKIVLGQRIFGIRIKKSYSSKFMYYYMISDKFQAELESRATGTTVIGLRQPELLKCKVRFPTYKEQQRIVKILSDIDYKIAINNKINDNLEKQVHALFRAWFVDFLPFDGQIPSNWRYVSFSDILTPRVEKSSDPSLQMFSVTDTGIHPRNEKFKKKLSMSGTKSKIIYQDDLVFGMSREILNWGVMRWPVGGVSSAYNVFSVCKDINTYYLETYMRSNIHYFKDLIRPASREGQGIDKNALMHKEILMPPENVLHSYYHHEDTLTRLIHNNIDENTRLSIIRYTLLPKLMFGEIDVSDIQL